uniref:Microtubule-binding protein TANGLED1 n=1 Tax=Zea mays TaxID=4577 RepID=A0A804UAB8_MAIZE
MPTRRGTAAPERLRCCANADTGHRPHKASRAEHRALGCATASSHRARAGRAPHHEPSWLSWALVCRRPSCARALGGGGPRMRGGASAQKRSPSGKFGGIVGGEGAQWRRMSLPAMLLDETVQVSQFARGIVTTAGAMNREPPRTPKPAPRTRKPAAGEPTPLHARRAREKQSHRGGTTTRGAGTATPPSRSRVRSRIQFKPVSSVAVSRPSVSANRVSPKNRPWAKKAVMFQNPMFHASTSAAIDPCATSSPSKKQKRLYKTRSPVVAQQIPHKFLVKVATERARIQSQDAREGPARETRRRS